MVDRPARDRLAKVIEEILSNPSSLQCFSAHLWERRRDKVIEEIADFVTETMTVILPTHPGPWRDKDVVEVWRPTLERSLVFLQSDEEFTPRSWSLLGIFSVTGFLAGAVGGVIGAIGKTPWHSWFGRTGLLLFCVGIGPLFLIYVVNQFRMGWQIFRVRVLRQDLTPFFLRGQQLQSWPFESWEQYERVQRELLDRNDGTSA